MSIPDYFPALSRVKLFQYGNVSKRYADGFIMSLPANECCVSEMFNIVSMIVKYWVCLLFSLVREILLEYPETFHTDIKEKNYVCNILKSVPRGGEIDIVQRNDLEIRES